MIFFKTVRWKNIFSYGDHFTEIQLDRSPSTLITGENGSGKSTILEAVCFGLFGKPFRRIKKADIINSKNGKGALVEIEFEHRLANRTDHYLIRRGVKPEIFEVFKNDQLVSQNAASKDYQAQLQTNVLKCDFNVFTQIVLVGEATHVSFMRMRSQDRRAFVETVLNLNVFSMMNKVHAGQLAVLKEYMHELKTRYQVTETKLEFSRDRVKDLERAVVRSTEQENERVIHEIVSLEEEVALYQEKIDGLKASLISYNEADSKKLRSKLKAIRDMMTKMDIKMSTLKSDIKRIEDTDVCHACHQSLPEDKKQAHICGLQDEIAKLKEAKVDLTSKEKDAEDMVTADDAIVAQNNKILGEISSVQILMNDRTLKIDRLKNATATSKRIDNTDDIIEAKGQVVLLEDEFEKVRVEREAVADENEYHALIKNMLQDTGIKATMIKRFIPVINQTINHNLAKLGFFGRFTLDENFEETIKARGFDTLGYNSFSEGEKLRIDLAVLLAWRDMARMQGILNTNLLMFDEVIDASMDANGTDAFTNLLTALQDTNIFIISHSPEKIIDKVRSQISFHKAKNGFSKMKDGKRD